MAGKRQHEIRRGLIKVRIRQRKSNLKSGYTVSVVRLYRNGSEWKESARFERDDIPLIRLVLDEAYTWILSRGGELE
ncbi:MAG: hypothetical protein R3C28_14560 [Pirellulaceae bacterium]